MDLIKRGRKPINHLDKTKALKQQKRHEYYLKFKSSHPNYYKKIKKVENVDDVPKENELLNKIDNIIQSLNEKLQELKNLIHN